MTTPRKEKAPWQGRSFGTAQTTGESYPTPTNKRESRALMALLARDLTREQFDRVVGCSNGPDLARRIRQTYGVALPCELQPVRDRDGCLVKRGVYRPTSQDRQRMRAILAQEVRR